ncbi:hypothetical protein ECC02_010224 [Trypanosoma cruzi]|uniref:Uncharacterized protein n=1 Tax=Trypanosoma cruzi TaxID=5693 RepID=A0A7J6XS41_TRYCR|nr:hypothetical protein ECC02_010224 [Trypanosoma cruzi]
MDGQTLLCLSAPLLLSSPLLLGCPSMARGGLTHNPMRAAVVRANSSWRKGWPPWLVFFCFVFNFGRGFTPLIILSLVLFLQLLQLQPLLILLLLPLQLLLSPLASSPVSESSAFPVLPLTCPLHNCGSFCGRGGGDVDPSREDFLWWLASFARFPSNKTPVKNAAAGREKKKKKTVGNKAGKKQISLPVKKYIYIYIYICVCPFFCFSFFFVLCICCCGGGCCSFFFSSSSSFYAVLCSSFSLSSRSAFSASLWVSLLHGNCIYIYIFVSPAGIIAWFRQR